MRRLTTSPRLYQWRYGELRLIGWRLQHVDSGAPVEVDGPSWLMQLQHTGELVLVRCDDKSLIER
jgi:hypothetical protein